MTLHDSELVLDWQKELPSDRYTLNVSDLISVNFERQKSFMFVSFEGTTLGVFPQ